MVKDRKCRIDTDWFNERIRETHGSQRLLAKKMTSTRDAQLDISTLSLMLRGRQDMRDHYKHQLAKLLGVSFEEICRRAGVVPSGASAEIPLSGTVDRDWGLRLLDETTDTVVVPPDVPSEGIAVRCMTSNSENAVVDGWILYAEKPRKFSTADIGRLCLYAADSGSSSVGVLQRGYQAGKTNVHVGVYGTLATTMNVSLEWVAPVLWIKPN